uniref:AlNc14C65G4632 protein n=1 Tax=Albugo laibachii Nc14 TaxID=890382 RepID=F0WDB2_9STRA|nr:AlNc14C65G4632 [Albugo laibachii Nc14]|eukprot:CCA19184.1 AlNc14C65G4632 [Albugo laibachii Nc14]
MKQIVLLNGFHAADSSSCVQRTKIRGAVMIMSHSMRSIQRSFSRTGQDVP